jgi:serine/threonine protein kinase
VNRAGESIDSLVAALDDRYAVESLLGRGATASVYLAHDRRHGRRVALKVLHDALGSAVDLERFQREIRVAARLQHPHILPLFDSGADAGRLWYATPLVDSGSLRQRLEERGPLPPPLARAFGAEVADALAHAYAAGIVHRDIKPENILLTGDGHALLADFGIAAVLDPVTSGERSLTEGGIAIGTPLYMSPEQATGSGAYDGRSDIYALGAVLFEALTGRPPFEGQNVREVIVRRLVDDPPSARRLQTDVPADLDRVVRRAMARRPDDRFATAAESLRRFGAPQRNGGSSRGRFAPAGSPRSPPPLSLPQQEWCSRFGTDNLPDPRRGRPCWRCCRSRTWVRPTINTLPMGLPRRSPVGSPVWAGSA